MVKSKCDIKNDPKGKEEFATDMPRGLQDDRNDQRHQRGRLEEGKRSKRDKDEGSKEEPFHLEEASKAQIGANPVKVQRPKKNSHLFNVMLLEESCIADAVVNWLKFNWTELTISNV